MDAIMVGSALHRRTWFLARSDVFRKKLLAKFLTFIGIIPIYRLLEGAENLQKNDETFEKCSKMLEENKAIIIFSEGLCIQERRLRKLKKGSARIAFGSEEKNDFNLDLMIVPVGINYSANPWKFRSGLYIEYGEPFAMSSYKELYLQDKARAMNIFTRDLEQRMKQLLVVIENKEHDTLVNDLEEMLLPEWCAKSGLDPKNAKETHKISQQIANMVNEASVAFPEKVKVLTERVGVYQKTLKSLGMRDWLLSPREIAAMTGGGIIKDFFFFSLLFPFWLFGVITNYLPYKIPYLIAQKIVKHVEWHASVNGTISVFLWQIFFGIESLAVALVFRNWYVLVAFMIAMPVCGVIAQEYWRKMKKSQGRSALVNAFRADKQKIQNLIAERAAIITATEELKNTL